MNSIQLKCCGYFNATDFAEVGGHCSSQDFLNGLNQPLLDIKPPNQPNETVLNNFCVTPITAFADMTLNNIFT